MILFRTLLYFVTLIILLLRILFVRFEPIYLYFRTLFYYKEQQLYSRGSQVTCYPKHFFPGEKHENEQLASFVISYTPPTVREAVLWYRLSEDSMF